MHRMRKVLDEVGEEAGAEHDRGKGDDRLGQYEPKRRCCSPQSDADPSQEADERKLVERLALFHLLLDVLGTAPRRA